MHYENNFRTSLFTFVYMSCFLIIVSCNNESPKFDSRTQYFSTEKPIQPYASNNNVTSSGHTDTSDTSTAVKPVVLEGGSTVSVDITRTSKTSTPNDSLNVKILELSSLPDGLNDSSPSNKKPHKGRKGVEIDDMISVETPIDNTALNVLKTESRKQLGESLNNTISHPISSSITSIVNSTTETAFSIPTVSSQIVKQERTDPVNKLSNGNAVSTISKNGTNQDMIIGSKSSKASKPVTRDDGDFDNSSYSLTATESDYIIPIVATIFAAPLLIVLGMFLYKRSKEFWERRHYRRMDFLIDGMYND